MAVPRPAAAVADLSSTLRGGRRAALPSQRRLARRRWLVMLTKRFLPIAAVALLSTVALYPEWSRDRAAARLALRGEIVPPSGQMTDAVYHGVDERGRPYTVTASSAREVEPGRVDLVNPKGDVAGSSGGWAMLQSRNGVYRQHLGNLDLSGEVTLYRDDGTVLSTDSANLDLRSGAGASADRVHVEGPFGTLDAQGFTATDRGAILHFQGPGHLLLNSRRK